MPKKSLATPQFKIQKKTGTAIFEKQHVLGTQDSKVYKKDTQRFKIHKKSRYQTNSRHTHLEDTTHQETRQARHPHTHLRGTQKLKMQINSRYTTLQ